MKLEALEKAVATAHQQVQALRDQVTQSAQVARKAKQQARSAKSKLKLAKQVAKRARKAAKGAKRSLAETSIAAERAAVEAADLERKLQKARKKAQQAQARGRKAKSSVAARSARAQSRSLAPKLARANPSPKPGARPESASHLDLKRPPPASAWPESSIQVPRDFAPTPTLPQAPTLPDIDVSTLPGLNTAT